jgi:uncharacterized protein YjlB
VDRLRRAARFASTTSNEPEMAMTKDMVQVKPEGYRFVADGNIPNNPSLPLLVYRGVLETGKDAASACEALFNSNHWPAAWRNGVYDYHHYHTTAHEVLGIVRGTARVRFGGPNGRAVDVGAGDVVVIPAGVAHRNEGASADLLVVGGYPEGQDWDICPAKPDERGCAAADIARVPQPAADPVYGKDGPLTAQWR